MRPYRAPARSAVVAARFLVGSRDAINVGEGSPTPYDAEILASTSTEGPRPMTLTSPLSTAPALDPFKFDRRRSPRTDAHGWAMATFCDEQGQARLARVQLVDSSRYGLGVLSPVPIAPGSGFTVHPENPSLRSTRGAVARCISTDNGHRIGLHTVHSAAA